MENKVENIYLEEFIDFSDILKGYELISSNITFDNEICILAKKKNLFSIDNYQYKVIIGAENYTEEIFLNSRLEFHFVDKLQDEELILVNSRSNYYGKDDYDKNANIFDYQGNLVREFLLGDGIEKVQVNSNNEIWSSYFDEGVIGNYGWNVPIGKNGLICWDHYGNKIYEYNYDNKNPAILDCYALNVENKNLVWFYSYTRFPIVRIKNKQEVKVYENIPIKGFNNFVIWKDFILCSQGYNDDKFHLLKIDQNGNTIEIKPIQFFDENERIVLSSSIISRGDLFYFNFDKKFFKFSLREFINNNSLGSNKL